MLFHRPSVWMSHADPVRERKDHSAQICEVVCGGSRKTRYGSEKMFFFFKEMIVVVSCWLTDRRLYPILAGVEADGIYRVSGNLAIIQKLRFLVDQGKFNSVII